MGGVPSSRWFGDGLHLPWGSVVLLLDDRGRICWIPFGFGISALPDRILIPRPSYPLLLGVQWRHYGRGSWIWILDTCKGTEFGTDCRVWRLYCLIRRGFPLVEDDRATVNVNLRPTLRPQRRASLRWRRASPIWVPKAGLGPIWAWSVVGLTDVSWAFFRLTHCWARIWDPSGWVWLFLGFDSFLDWRPKSIVHVLESLIYIQVSYTLGGLALISRESYPALLAGIYLPITVTILVTDIIIFTLLSWHMQCINVLWHHLVMWLPHIYHRCNYASFYPLLFFIFFLSFIVLYFRCVCASYFAVSLFR